MSTIHEIGHLDCGGRSECLQTTGRFYPPRGRHGATRPARSLGEKFFFPFLRRAPNIRAGQMDSIIETRELQIERKLFSIDLRENGRGRFLRITEDSQGHRNVIIVPISGVDDFADAIDDVLASEAAAEG